MIGGLALGWAHADFVELLVSASLGAAFLGTLVPGLMNLRTSPELRQNIKEATFLTAKTTAMVCWLFVGSALFSAVFALHGGQSLIERWVLSMNLSPLGFQFVAQLIIFLLGWPLEWTEIIVIFCPIFIPLLEPFPDRSDAVRHDGGGESAGGVPLAAGGDVGLLPEGRGAETCHSKPDFRRDDALHVHRLLVPRLHVHLAGDDAMAAGVSLRQLVPRR